MLKTKLQALTNCKSESLSILFRNFEEKFPQEKRLHSTFLRDKIFNENSSITDEQLVEKLNKLFSK